MKLPDHWLSPRDWLRRLPSLLLQLLLLLGLVWGAEWVLTRDAATGPAPLFSATTVEGERFALADLQGEPALLHFWASWCPICRFEQGSIAWLAKQGGVMSIAMESGDRHAVATYLAEQQITLPTVVDERGEIARSYGVRGVPASFILNPTGEVVFVTRGYTTALGLTLRLWLARWL